MWKSISFVGENKKWDWQKKKKKTEKSVKRGKKFKKRGGENTAYKAEKKESLVRWKLSMEGALARLGPDVLCFGQVLPATPHSILEIRFSAVRSLW